MTPSPIRLPDPASLEAILAGLDPASADADLIPAISVAFSGSDFSLAPIEDDYCGTPARSSGRTARASANCGRG